MSELVRARPAAGAETAGVEAAGSSADESPEPEPCTSGPGDRERGRDRDRDASPWGESGETPAVVDGADGAEQDAAPADGPKPNGQRPKPTETEPWRLTIVETSHHQGFPYSSGFAIETVWLFEEALEASNAGRAVADSNSTGTGIGIGTREETKTQHPAQRQPSVSVRVFFRVRYFTEFPGWVRRLLELGARRELRGVYAKWTELAVSHLRGGRGGDIAQGGEQR